MSRDVILKRGEKVLFIGDSITDAGRRDPNWAPLGRGYVCFASNWLRAGYAELELQFENRGIGGNTVLDLKERWQQDAVAESPNILSCLIGINDTMRVIRRCPNHTCLTPERYEHNYAELLNRISDACGCRFILWEPFLITHETNSMAVALLQRYIEAVHRLAERFGAILIDTQRIFTEACKKRSPEYWAGDSVHPTPQGHALMAQAFLKAIGA